jgi:DNA-binding NtrC family response regulator
MRKHTLLVVDDEPDVVKSVQDLLRFDYKVLGATRAADALKLIREQPVHVVLTDQRMPEMTGVELLRRAGGECPEAIRIIFTGYADIKAVVDAVNEGQIYRYLTKPWDPDELVATLRQACEHHDQIAGRKRLLLDLRDHLARCQPLLQGLAGGQAEAGTLAQATPGLLARLDRALAAEPGASAP